MTEWTVAQAGDRPVPFLLQEGDLTHENSEPEWANASDGFAVLEDGGVPYALCLGNHDIGAEGDTSLFRQHFPV